MSIRFESRTRKEKLMHFVVHTSKHVIIPRNTKLVINIRDSFNKSQTKRRQDKIQCQKLILSSVIQAYRQLVKHEKNACRH